MSNENKTAKELFLAYKKQWQELVDTYCIAKNNAPYGRHEELARAIWRIGCAVQVWNAIALKNEQHKYYQEG